MKILYLITSLGAGGAESFLLELCRGMISSKHEICVVTLKDNGDLIESYKQAGIRVLSLGITKSPVSCIQGCINLLVEVRRFNPDLVHSWMYHADFLSILLKIIFPKLPLLWCIRNLSLDKKDVRSNTRVVAKLCAWASRYIPSRIICNGESVRNYHIAYGYAADKFRVIYNGFDIDRFYPSLDMRAAFRMQYGLPDDAFVFGLIGRFHPVKGHAGVVAATARLLTQNDKVYLVFVGGGDPQLKQHILFAASERGVSHKIKIIQQQQEMPLIYNGLDVLISNSRSEGFSNVIGEAMACGVACIVTNVGESASIVGSLGAVCSYGNKAELEHTVEWMALNAERIQPVLRVKVRKRIEQYFSLQNSCRGYQRAYESVIYG